MKSFFTTSIIVLTAILLCSSYTFFPEKDKDDNKQKGHQIKTVVIDAGHGGKDPGCVSKNAKEKDIALAITLLVGKYIKDNMPDVKVIYTRKKDVFIKLYERAAIANRNKADIFISIHCNANNSSKPYGTETYVMGLHKTDANLAVAKRENSVVTYEEDYSAHYDGIDPNSPASHILFATYQSTLLNQSIELAKNIEDQFKNRAKRKSKGVHQAGFFVLYKTTMPSVLIETGFLTNQKEEKFLTSKYGREIIASAIYRAFRDYKKKSEGSGNISNYKKDDPDPQPPIPPKTDTIPVQDTTQKNQTDKINDVLIPSDTTIITKKNTNSNDTTINNILLYNKTNTNHNTNAGKKDTISETIVKSHVSELIYRVQFMMSTKPVKTDDTQYNNISEIIYEKTSSGIYKYMAGIFTAIDKATKLQNNLRKKGYKDAFVVAYYKGKRITIKEALAIQKAIN